MSIPQARYLGRLARLAALFVATSAVWIPGSIALAQTPSAGSSDAEARAPQPIALEDVLDRDEAGFGVPFPQRDLHLVSVSPAAASELERGTTPSPGGGTIPDSYGKK